jgi:tRNA modification GTPase
VDFATDDTIVAIATPAGRGGIGVVRISGADALAIATSLLALKQPLANRHATFARVGVGGAALADEVVATYFQAPHSYTGQDVVEVSAHGTPVVLTGIVQAAIGHGARLAAPGEFTLRSFLNGKRDLIQAEAVGDLIAAATPLQARTAFDQLEGTLTRRIAEIDAVLFDLIARLEASLDFPDEGYHFVAPSKAHDEIAGVVRQLDALLTDATRGRMIREGATVVVAGRPNVGKSSLFNRLVGTDRAIVTPIPGTTRDLITEAVDVGGLAVTLVDTAGWRETADMVESEGVERGAQARGVADLVLVVLDRSEELSQEDRELLRATESRRRLVVLNKCDLPAFRLKPEATPPDAMEVSAATGGGFDALRLRIGATLAAGEALRDSAAISNMRHIDLLEDARRHLQAAMNAAGVDAPEEFVLTDLQAARAKLDEVVGTRTSEDVLRHIFEHFCIGK